MFLTIKKTLFIQSFITIFEPESKSDKQYRHQRLTFHYSMCENQKKASGIIRWFNELKNKFLNSQEKFVRKKMLIHPNLILDFFRCPQPPVIFDDLKLTFFI